MPRTRRLTKADNSLSSGANTKKWAQRMPTQRKLTLTLGDYTIAHEPQVTQVHSVLGRIHDVHPTSAAGHVRTDRVVPEHALDRRCGRRP